jgi:hypothetical protein
LGHGSHDSTHALTSNLLDTFAHHPHTKQEDAQSPEDIEQANDEFPSGYISHDINKLVIKFFVSICGASVL